MTRKSKIARLPLPLRTEVNRRLENGEPGKTILKWLNALPQVQSILADHFNGRSITKQNLSEWKQNGFHDWQIHEAAQECAQQFDLRELAAQESEIGPLSHKLAHWLALRYAVATYAMEVRSDRPQQEWERLRRVSADILAMRRSDILAGRLQLEQQRLLFELSAADSDRAAKAGATSSPPSRTIADEVLLI